MTNFEYFVGSKTKPTFLVEIDTKNKHLQIYTPDKYSKNEEFIEKYTLGKKVLDTKYKNIIFCEKPVSYKSKIGYKHVCKLILNISNKYYLVSEDITMIKSL
jgi:hypothetical protein